MLHPGERTHTDNAILERDPVYHRNVTCLIMRINQGKLPPQAFGSLQGWLADNALRRNHKRTKAGL
jgi:hypothetical protein